ncbi:MAG: mercuric reductase [Acidobacteriota bacterium]|nr:mercuric reductase [Acidobacteriota bacterium]
MAAFEPLDQHNLALAHSVRPPGWVHPEPRGRYNLVVLGGGTAGLVTAAAAAGLGARVALVERKWLGGDCLNVGCVPSKAMIRSARAVAAARRASRFGLPDAVAGEVDFGAVMERMRRLRARLAPHDGAERFRELGIDVFFGEGRFVGPRRVEVDGTRLDFARAVIATGARAAVPSIPGLESAGYLTYETLFSLTERPRRLGVIGAGPVGCEMAQAFARLGSEVVLVETGHGILPREDREAAAWVQAAMERDGVRLLCCGKDLAVVSGSGGPRLTVRSHGRSCEVEVDRIFVAVGRVPRVEGLGLEAAGVESGPQGVVVDDRLRTSNRAIFAAGDICSRYRFTHAADAMARIVVRNALFAGREKASALVMPWCTYTSPELAHVGLTAEQARERGEPVRTVRVPMADVDRAVLDGETEGFVKVHHRGGSDRILGATIVAARAGELISGISVALHAGAGLATLSRSIHPYPTQGEVLRRVGDAWNRTRLTPRLRRVFAAWLAWRRR